MGGLPLVLAVVSIGYPGAAALPATAPICRAPTAAAAAPFSPIADPRSVRVCMPGADRNAAMRTDVEVAP